MIVAQAELDAILNRKIRKRVLELPVANRNRMGGSSKVAGSVSGSIRAGTRILGTFGRLLLAPEGVDSPRSPAARP